jgi:hypothetical protein
VPDDVEEFWSEIRPAREPAAKKEASKEAFQRGLQGLTASVQRVVGQRAQEEQRTLTDEEAGRLSQRANAYSSLAQGVRQLRESTGGMDLDYRGPSPGDREALRREFEEEGADMNDFTEAVQELDSDDREPFNTGMPRQEDLRRIGRSQSQIAEARRSLRGGSPGFQGGIQEAAQVARFAQRREQRELVEFTRRDPRVNDLLRALANLGFPSAVSLTLDGRGSRSLTITPEAGSSVYLDGLAIIVTRSV